MSDDTREKLESDCRKLIVKIQKRTFSGRDPIALRSQLLALLDRQAAITKAEQREWWGDVVAELIAGRDKLREKVRHQTKQLAQVQVALEERNNGEMKRNWTREKEKLTAERDELRRQVSELRELNDSLHARIEEAREALS